MKMLIVRSGAGRVQSVAFVNPELVGSVHLEVDGATVHAIDVDADTIRRDELTGVRGPEARKRAAEQLRRVIEIAARSEGKTGGQ